MFRNICEIFMESMEVVIRLELSDDAAIKEAYDKRLPLKHANFICKMCSKDKKPAHVSTEIFDHYKKMRSTSNFKKLKRASKNWRTEIGDSVTGIAVHTSGLISIYQHEERLVSYVISK
ncbi:hypothetical protein Scep_010478 [Stephania cephalantha]|uniref:Uncharacterized protein n=1 Tax=Stephania cephalantha TaxID=152367 RepID=A0AAP0PE61_9MAGN